MKTIAYRKSGLGALYIFTLLIGVMLVIIEIMSGLKIFFMGIIGLLTIGISVFILTGFFKTPYNAIQLNENMQLILPNGVTFNIKDISDVSYRKALNKYSRRSSSSNAGYKWGSVTISTCFGSHTVKYLANCEDVAKELTRLMFGC